MALQMSVNGSRKPGPAGLPFDRAIDGLTVEPSSYQQLKTWTGTVFVRKKSHPRIEADHRVKLRAKVVEADLSGSRGTTGSELYLTYVVRDRGDGRYHAFFQDIQIVSTITIRPNHKFDALVDFKPHYDEFAALVAKKRSRKAALTEFCNRHIKEERDHRGTIIEVSTDFTGLRAKTMQHEVSHARDAQSQTVDQIDNLLHEWKKDGRRRDKAEPADKRADTLLKALFRIWDTDVGNKSHRKIVEHDCLFMIKMYEHNILRLPSASDALSSDIVDDLTFLAMHELSQPPPWL